MAGVAKIGRRYPSRSKRHGWATDETMQVRALPPAKKEVEMIAHECPVCHGQGTVSKPPYIAGDQQTWIASNAWDKFPCPACNGQGIVWEQEKGVIP